MIHLHIRMRWLLPVVAAAEQVFELVAAAVEQQAEEAKMLVDMAAHKLLVAAALMELMVQRFKVVTETVGVLKVSVSPPMMAVVVAAVTTAAKVDIQMLKAAEEVVDISIHYMQKATSIQVQTEFTAPKPTRHIQTMKIILPVSA
jgi:hypothetical protein